MSDTQDEDRPGRPDLNKLFNLHSIRERAASPEAAEANADYATPLGQPSDHEDPDTIYVGGMGEARHGGTGEARQGGASRATAGSDMPPNAPPEPPAPPVPLTPARREPIDRPEPRKRTLRGHFNSYWYNIADHGDYFRLSPQQKTGQGQSKTLSDAQLREILIRGVQEKGWDTFYFYKGGKIDQALTQRANAMLRDELCRSPREWKSGMPFSFENDNHRLPKQHRAGPLYGHAISVSTNRMATAEPWAGWYHTNFGRKRLEKQELKALDRSYKDAARNERRHTNAFH